MALPSPTVPRVAYTIDEALIALSIGRTLFYELVEAGKLRTVMAGRRRLVPVAAVEEFLSAGAAV